MGKRKKNKNTNSNYNSTSLAVLTANESSNKDDVNAKNTNNDEDVIKKCSYFFSNRKNYDYQGIKNETEFQDFIKVCKLKQADLKEVLIDELLDVGYTDVLYGDGYVYAKGTIPILLTAHMDTVHKETVADFYEYYDEEKKQHIISSPQGIGGDDRCGIYMILQIIKTHKCSVLFCEDEEIGGVGSRKFCKTDLVSELSELKYLIELDRANGTDAVFYDCANYDFIKFIEDNTGYKEEYGSFSDISNLSPACKVASVNLSCGYYNAHSTSEYVIIEEMLNTIDVVKRLLDVECEQFEYIEFIYKRNRNYYGYGYDYNDYLDDYSDYYRYSNNPHKNSTETYKEKSLMLYIHNEDLADYEIYISNGATFYEALGKFFFDNPEYCFENIYDYEYYDERIYDDGWYFNI